MREEFPRLSMIAAVYLAGHASTALQEQKFPYAGLNDDSRRHLDPEAQKDLLMCAANTSWLREINGAIKRCRTEADLQGEQRPRKKARVIDVIDDVVVSVEAATAAAFRGASPLGQARAAVSQQHQVDMALELSLQQQ